MGMGMGGCLEIWVWVKLNHQDHQETPGFSLWFHLSGFSILGTHFTHSHMIEETGMTNCDTVTAPEIAHKPTQEDEALP